MAIPPKPITIDDDCMIVRAQAAAAHAKSAATMTIATDRGGTAAIPGD